MHKTHKEIQDITDNYSIIPWSVLDKIIQKLDDEEIRDLTALFEEMHNNYNVGYSDGYDKAYDKGYDEGYDEGWDNAKELHDEGQSPDI